MAAVAHIDRKVAAALHRTGLANRNQTLVVGVSGGADSSTLLYSLSHLTDICEISLHVCHLNHDFRGEEADEDARFVESLARELGLPVTVEKRDPIAYQEEQGISSFEQGAREMRYEFMARVAHRVGASAVAVGHTSDDLAETVLLHILRGTGLHGLRGMTEAAPWPWPTGLETPFIFRPLLEVSKSQTVEYCEELGRAYRQDSGNLLFRFTRNRVRRELMPLLAEEYNPRVSEALVRLAHSSSQELDFLETELDRAWSDLLVVRCVADSPPRSLKEVVLSREGIMGLHPALQRLALRRAYVLVKGDPRRLGERHLKAMGELTSKRESQGILHLPMRVIFRVSAEEVSLISGGDGVVDTPLQLEGRHTFSFPCIGEPPGHHRAGDWEIETEMVQLGQLPDLTPPNRYVAYLNAATLGPAFAVRTRLPGDRFQPLGMRSEKKLQDFMVDAKVRREIRDGLPLFVTGDRIAWVVGHRIAEWARVPEDLTPADSILRVAFVRIH